MHGPSPSIIDALSDLDDHVAVELLTLLRALSTDLEQHYAEALARRQQRQCTQRQPSLWTDDEPPF